MKETKQSLSPPQLGKRWCLRVVWISTLLLGLCLPFIPPEYEKLILLIYAAPVQLAYAVWLAHDLIEQRYPASRYFLALLLVFGFFMLPWYLFQTRGKRAFISLMKMVGLYVLVLALLFVAALVSYGVYYTLFYTASEQSPLLQ